VVSVVYVYEVVLMWLGIVWWVKFFSESMFLMWIIWLVLMLMMVFIFCSIVIRLRILGSMVVLRSLVRFWVCIVVRSICLVFLMFGYGRVSCVFCRCWGVCRCRFLGCFLMMVLNCCSMFRW